MSKCILLVEDDYALAMGTEYTLKAEGYVVCHAKNLKEARERLNMAVEGSGDYNIDLILLDVMLPDGDGFSFLKEIIEKDVEIPVIFATAVSDEANIVLGLDLGADDYITKPYKVKEMLSRISAVLRRQERATRLAGKTSKDDSISVELKESEEKSGEITFGEHRYIEGAFRLYKGNELVECTPAELRLLREFLNNQGIVITRNQLMERLYDTENTFIDDNTLSVYIKRLRDKLGDDAGFIKTVKGVGYRFERMNSDEE